MPKIALIAITGQDSLSCRLFNKEKDIRFLAL